MTAVEERCALTDLPKSGCAHCRTPETAAVDPGELSPDDVLDTFDARYPGRCAVRGCPIEVGDVIARLVDGSGYCCERCLP